MNSSTLSRSKDFLITKIVNNVTIVTNCVVFRFTFKSVTLMILVFIIIISLNVCNNDGDDGNMMMLAMVVVVVVAVVMMMMTTMMTGYSRYRYYITSHFSTNQSRTSGEG
jgi:Na+/melibiose symporter-like transporter